jgi:hypothetical protein
VRGGEIVKLAKNYGLSITLLALFLISWLGQWIFQWQEFVSNAQMHTKSATVAEFVPDFLSATFENWQSEFLQLLTFVVLTTFLIHKGSHESKDSDEEMKAQLTRIENLLSKKRG